MTDTKNWHQSKTIWGALVAILASILSGFGFSIDEASQSQLSEAIVQLIGALGAIVAIYGRLNATDVIS